MNPSDMLLIYFAGFVDNLRYPFRNRLIHCFSLLSVDLKDLFP